MQPQELQIKDYRRTLRVEIETATGEDIDEMEARRHADAFVASRWPEDWWDFDYSELDCMDTVAVVYVQ